MTTKQLAAKARRLFKEFGSIEFTNFCVPRSADYKGDIINVNSTGIYENQIGISCDNNNWFLSMDELTYSELKYIVRQYEKITNKK